MYLNQLSRSKQRSDFNHLSTIKNESVCTATRELFTAMSNTADFQSDRTQELTHPYAEMKGHMCCFNYSMGMFDPLCDLENKLLHFHIICPLTMKNFF